MPERENPRSITSTALRRIMVRALVEMGAAGLHDAQDGSLATLRQEVHRAGRTTRAACRMRQMGMYLAHVVLAMSMTRAGHLFARDRTTARFACLQVEEWREASSLDRAFDRLEPALTLWLAQFAPDNTRKRRRKARRTV
jgi:hypothetical protein